MSSTLPTFRLVALASVPAALALSCAARPAPAPVQGRPDAEWTMLVYMAADDDLEQAALLNIEEMAEVGSTGPVNVIVQIDRAPATHNGGGFARTPLMNLRDFSSTKRLRVDHGAVLELADLGETCTGDPDPLAAFIAWGLTTFPAKKTALVLWDHGGATHGFGWDITNDNRALSVVDLRRGIGAGLAAARRPRFDLLGFDACLMSNLGVAYELRGFSDLFLGSEEVEPSIGWSYAPIIRAMAANASARELAAEIVKSFEAAAREAHVEDMATMSALDATRLDAVVSALDDLGDGLRVRGHEPADWYPIAKARTAAEQYGAGAGERSPYATVDAVDFVSRTERALRQPSRVAAAIADATIVNFHGAGRPDAHGLSLTFPRQAKERVPVDDALELATGGGARWDGFLRAYVDLLGADGTPPTVTGFTVTASDDSVDLHAELPDQDLAETAAFVGTPDDKGGLSLLSLTVLPSGEASFRWPKLLPTLGDGHDEVPATVFEGAPYLDASGQLVRITSVAGALYPHGVATRAIDVVAYLRVPTKGPPALLGVYRFAEGGAGSQLSLHPDDRFAPMVRTVAVDGKTTRVPSTSTVSIGGAAKLTIQERPAPPRDYVVGFRVTDYAANRVWQTARVRVL